MAARDYGQYDGVTRGLEPRGRALGSAHSGELI